MRKVTAGGLKREAARVEEKGQRIEDYQRYGYAHAGYKPPEKKWVSRLEAMQQEERGGG